LESDAEDAKFKENKKKFEKGNKAVGSFGDGKAKIHSSLLRKIVSLLEQTKSLLVIISQTRDNLGFGFETKTRSGGRALKFYARFEVWSSVVQKLKKKVNDKDRKIGIIAKLECKKNHITGMQWSVNTPIYWSAGVDDVGSCVDYLVEEGHWKVTKGLIHAPEFGLKLNRENLVHKIETHGTEDKLRKVCKKIWSGVMNECLIVRKQRYA
jgi:hypothetical protein